MKHRPECNKAFAIHEFETAYYQDLYPDYCRKCDGWGGFHSTYDPSPAGISLGSGYMEEFEPCNNCIEKGHCPRFGVRRFLSINTKS